MRISLLLATLVAGMLSIGVAAVAVQAQQVAPGAPRGQAQSAPRAAGTNTAVIDINHVFKHYRRFQAQMEDVKKDIEAFETFVRGEQKKFATERDKLNDWKPNSPEYKQLEERLARLQSEMQVELQIKQREFLEREAKVYFNAYTEIVDQVAQFADRQGIGLVLRFSAEEIDAEKRDSVLQGVNRAVVFQRNLNITDYVLDRLNRGTAPAEVSRQPQPQIPPRPAPGINR